MLAHDGMPCTAELQAAARTGLADTPPQRVPTLSEDATAADLAAMLDDNIDLGDSVDELEVDVLDAGGIGAIETAEEEAEKAAAEAGAWNEEANKTDAHESNEAVAADETGTAARDVEAEAETEGGADAIADAEAEAALLASAGTASTKTTNDASVPVPSDSEVDAAAADGDSIAGAGTESETEAEFVLVQAPPSESK